MILENSPLIKTPFKKNKTMNFALLKVDNILTDPLIRIYVQKISSLDAAVGKNSKLSLSDYHI